MPFTEPPPPPTPESISIQNPDPEQIARFFDAHPERLAAPDLDPALAVTLARVLIRADRTFMAERMLSAVRERFPTDTRVIESHARILVMLGRWEAAIALLKPLAEAEPPDAAVLYTLGNAYLARRPRVPEDEARALAVWERVLQVSPAFVGPDGVNAAQLRVFNDRLRSRGRPR